MLLKRVFLIFLPVFLFLTSCKDNPDANCPTEEQIESRDSFRNENYAEVDGQISIITPDGNIPVRESFTEDFEDYGNLVALFYTNFQEATEKVWGTMTLQSPSAKTVGEYTALQDCIFDGTCDFIDNKVELVVDPTDASNTCLRFDAVAKTDDMVTSKSSIQSPLLFFENGDDLWFSADYLIQGNLPTTLADFENEFFDGRPGPRILISNDKLAIENKFGDKKIYRHVRDIKVPNDQWFNVVVHFNFSAENDGLIELWQDGVQLISANGVNLPLVNSIQNSLEIGISATEKSSTVFVDNVKIDHKEF